MDRQAASEPVTAADLTLHRDLQLSTSPPVTGAVPVQAGPPAVERVPAVQPWRARPYRVVFLDHVARLSGGEIALVRLLPALEGAVDAHVVLAENGPLVGRLEEVGATVEVLPLDPEVRDLRRSEVTVTGLGPGSAPAMARYVWTLSRRLRALRPDLVHTNSLKSALYGGTAGRLARVPVLWHVRDRIAPDYLPPAAVRLVHAAAWALPRGIVTNSTATLETLPRMRKAQVLYNPVVPDVIPRQRTETSAGGGGLRVGLLGRLAPWKGQHVFLEAFARAFPTGDAVARVIGSPMFGEERYAEQLREQAEWLGVADRVEWLGFREDVFSELAELDILVHCSTTPEPFGQVVVEGMAAGLPVIASAAGGPAEIIRDGVDGVLVPPSDVDALARQLTALAADPALRRRLGESATVSSRRFSPEAARTHVLEVYRQLLRTRE